MLSRLQVASRSVGSLQPKLVNTNNKIAQNFVSKRWSGHNVMNIEPTNYGWKHHKNMVHFYSLISIVPVAIINAIISLRANPELSEIPDGYEPRHWEYFKHPITRWMARYCFAPMELEHEMYLSALDGESEAIVMRKLAKEVEETMKFYNDHRSSYFRPVFTEYIRVGRDQNMHDLPMMMSVTNEFYDKAYSPEFNTVPTEGYKSVD